MAVVGTGSLWSVAGQLVVGNLSTSNNLFISHAGQVACTNAVAGQNGGGLNTITVSDSGSVWNCGISLFVGSSGWGNRLVISGGGMTVNARGSIGGGSASSNNSVIVADSGSIWSNISGVTIGQTGGGNSLIVSNYGRVVGTFGDIGSGPSSSNNFVLVVDGGIWSIDSLNVGDRGSSNQMIIGGGSVFATDATIGVNSLACDNLLQLDSGNVIVTNGTGDATLEVRWGKLILNGGTLQVDRFVMTNSCAQLIRTGGTLIYGTAILDPSRDDDGDGLLNDYEQSHGLDPLNADADLDHDGDGMSNMQEFQAGTDPTNSASAFRIVEVEPVDDDVLLTWTTVGGKKYAVQTVTGDYTNDFIELAPVIIAPGIGESMLSVIHLGGATNAPGRFYRIRLVP